MNEKWADKTKKQKIKNKQKGKTSNKLNFHLEIFNFKLKQLKKANKGIYNSRVIKLSYKTELHIMTSHTE